MFAFDLDIPALLLDDIVRDGQPESEPLPDRLCRKEGVPDVVQMVGKDAASRILHLNDDRGAVSAGGDLHRAGPFDGLMGVDQEVHEYLAQPCGIAGNQRQAGLQFFADLDIFVAGLMAHQFQNLVQDIYATTPAEVALKAAAMVK